MPKKKEVKKKYLIEVDEDQLFALEKGCDTLARILCGQDSTMQDILENAWHKNVQEPQNLEYTCNEFWDMRHEVEETLMRLKMLCFNLIFNLPRNGNYGINYSEESDFLIDMYHTFRYLLFVSFMN